MGEDSLNMRAMSRLEVNVRRLLTRCEMIAKDDRQIDWKLEKYIQSLVEMITELQALPDKPPKDVAVEYVKRITFLKDFVVTAKLTSPVDRIVAAQMLPKGNTMVTDTSGPSVTQQIHQKVVAKYSQEVRSELLQNAKEPSKGGLRQRLSNAALQDEDLDALLKYNRNIQERIAENMLSMTSNMKEHALAASAVIRKDISSLETSDKLTDLNAAKLRGESLKLEEHTKSYWRCWLWLMIALVLLIFFNMVLFMKVAKKRV